MHVNLPIYLDNHATTRVDPRVVEAMWPYFTEIYGNAGSTTHAFGAAAKDAVDEARAKIAAAIGAKAKEIVWTSGATESNNLAIRGVAEKHAARGRHIISVTTEHPAVLDPLARLAQRGFEVTLLPVIPSPDPQAGLVRLDQLAAAIRDDTILVSIMLANNEIGAIQPLAEIGQLCKQRGVLLHTDATQAVGKIPVDVEALGVDLMSFTAHKIYGPKGHRAPCTFAAAARGCDWSRRSTAAGRKAGCGAARPTCRASSVSPGPWNFALPSFPPKRPAWAASATGSSPG